MRRSLAIVIAAIPTEELPPRTSSDWRRSSSSVSSEPQAVPKLSGIAPSLVQSSVGHDRDRGSRRDQRVLRVAAVELAAHAAHRRDHALTGAQLGAGRLDDLAGALDPEHAREAHGVAGAAGARDQLRAVEPERADADQHPTRLGTRDRQVLELEDLRPSGLMDDDGEHPLQPSGCARCGGRRWSRGARSRASRRAGWRPRGWGAR